MALNIVINARGAQSGARQATRSLDSIRSAARRLRRPLQGLNREFLTMNRTVGTLRGGFTGLVGAFGVSKLIQVADQYTSIQNRLRLVTTDAQELATVQNQLLQQSERSFVSLDGQVKLYQRIARSAGNLNKTTGEVLGFTDAVAKSLRISGVSAVEAEAAIIQFSQGLASGTLRGDELRSVLEQAPRLAQAIADGMKVPIGQLRELGQAGELTSEQIFKAIQSQIGNLNDEINLVKPTIGDLFTVIGNQFTTVIGQLDQSNGVTGNIVSNLVKIAENLGPTLIELIGKVQAFVFSVVGGIDQLILRARIIKEATGQKVNETSGDIVNFFTRAIGLGNIVDPRSDSDRARSAVNQAENELLIKQEALANLLKDLADETARLATQNRLGTFGIGDKNSFSNLAGGQFRSPFGNSVESVEADKEALKALADRAREIASIFEATRTPAEIFIRTMDRLKELRSDLGEETFNRAVQQAVDSFAEANAKLEEETQKSFSIMEEFGKAAAQNIQGAFADFLFDPFKDGVDGMLRNFVSVLHRMASELLANQILTSIFKSLQNSSGGPFQAFVGAALSSLSGTQRAIGGSIGGSGSGLYTVGERGTEVIASPARGVVLSNQAVNALSAVGGGGGANVQVINNTGQGMDATIEALDTAEGERRLMLVLERRGDEVRRRLGLPG